MNPFNVLALNFRNEDIGSWALGIVGIIIVVCIVYAILRALNAPRWLYRAAGVAALVLLLVVVIAFFFGN